jgi:PAS domain S-box-containing protein
MTKNNASAIINPQNLRTLIIDDSEDDVLLLLRELKRGGYNPEFQRIDNSPAMKKALQEKQWDIILCDYKMPNFSAPAAIVLLKETKTDIPIIVISGNIGEEIAIECMRLGAQDYIMKSSLSRLCPAIARETEEAKKRKRSEEELSQSEEKYRSVLENMQEGYFEVDLAGNYTFFNDSLCQIHGYPKEELMGMNNRQYTEEETAKKVFLAFNQVYKTGQHLKEINWQITRKDGSKRYIEASVSLRKDSLDKPVGFKGILRDITERKRAEEALSKSERYFKEITENSSDIIIISDEKGNIKYCSPSIERFAGYKPHEVIGKSGFDFIHSDEIKRASDDFGTAVREKDIQLSANLFKVLHKDGSERYFYGRGRNLLNHPDVAGIVMNVRDITEQKQAEDALKKSEIKYRTIFENAIEGIYQVTMEGRFVTANAALAHMAGYDSPEDLIESVKDIGKDLYVHPEDRKRFLKIREEMGFVEGFEVEFKKKDGTHFWVVINARAVKDEQGKVLYNEGLVEDITLRKQAEENLKESLEKLKKAVNTTIQVLVSALEIRDPYTAGHQSRSADLACAIATEMGLCQEKIDGLRMAGEIHDIGKLSIPVEILSKPSKLTNLEFSLIKEHSQSGFDMLKDIDSPWPLAATVHQHHERMNGTGYPKNLKGDDIIIEARILAVADVVEAMASHRPYRASLGIEKALEEIEQNKGILYDENVAEACLRLFREKGYTLE